MGKQLFELSQEYEQSGGKLLTEHEIELEIALRRGGFRQNNGR
ncbi:MAG TPA: hypothetical protein VFH31_14320 [Pyrinomonadaceae bacterium]|nr:hypothetical protein [Pyrinomonadaceae bacterium]